MDNQFQPLETGEVLSVDDSSQILIGHRTFRAGEFSEAIRAQMEYGLGGWTEEKDAWFSDYGIECEVLRFGATHWQKGKVRIRLEFSPDDGHQSVPPSAVSTPINVPPPATPSIPDDLDFESAAAIAEELEATPFPTNSLDSPPDLTPDLGSDSALDDLSIPMVFEEEEDLTLLGEPMNNTLSGLNGLESDFEENSFVENSFGIENFGENDLPENNFTENNLGVENFGLEELADPFGMETDLSLGEGLDSPSILVVEEEEILIDLSEPNSGNDQENSLLDDVWQEINQSSWPDDL